MVYVFLADGFETIEALAVVDMLRRAKIDTMTVGVTGKEVKTSHSINVTADITIDELNINDANAIVLPGGMPGTLNLEANSVVQSSIDFCVENGKYVCAICAAPYILCHKCLLLGREANCFQGFVEVLCGATISDKYVVTDGKFITARGAGVAVDFGLEIVKALAGNDLSNKIRETIQCQ